MSLLSIHLGTSLNLSHSFNFFSCFFLRRGWKTRWYQCQQYHPRANVHNAPSGRCTLEYKGSLIRKTVLLVPGPHVENLQLAWKPPSDLTDPGVGVPTRHAPASYTPTLFEILYVCVCTVCSNCRLHMCYTRLPTWYEHGWDHRAEEECQLSATEDNTF